MVTMTDKLYITIQFGLMLVGSMKKCNVFGKKMASTRQTRTNPNIHQTHASHTHTHWHQLLSTGKSVFSWIIRLLVSSLLVIGLSVYACLCLSVCVPWCVDCCLTTTSNLNSCLIKSNDFFFPSSTLIEVVALPTSEWPRFTNW